MIAVIGVPMLMIRRGVSKAFDTLVDLHEENIAKLIALEDHRCKYGSLPDGLTFEKIVCLRPDKLAKELEKSLMERAFSLGGVPSRNSSGFSCLTRM